MIDPPEIVRTTARPSAVIRLTVPRSAIRDVMGPAFQELGLALAAQGLTPAGPFYSYHFRLDPELFDFELGVPVAGPVAASGRVLAGELPAARVARTSYHGSYDGLGAAWPMLFEWIVAEGLVPAPFFWEAYVTGPATTPNPDGWVTELSRGLVD